MLGHMFARDLVHGLQRDEITCVIATTRIETSDVKIHDVAVLAMVETDRAHPADVIHSLLHAQRIAVVNVPHPPVTIQR
jgi:hypothetical protein